jgi:hypothetical protein
MTNPDTISHHGDDQRIAVIWRDGTWRCEMWKRPAHHLLRLYDWERLAHEYLVTVHTVTAAAEAMRRRVRHYGVPEDRLSRPHVGSLGRQSTVFTLCRWCLSHRAVLTLTRPGTDWYFCPDCDHQWAVPVVRPAGG